MEIYGITICDIKLGTVPYTKDKMYADYGDAHKELIILMKCRDNFHVIHGDNKRVVGFTFDGGRFLVDITSYELFGTPEND